jgi:hypothetical protein
MVIGSNVVQAAITQVDACSGCKFTAPATILVTAIEDSREQTASQAAEKLFQRGKKRQGTTSVVP